MLSHPNPVQTPTDLPLLLIVDDELLPRQLLRRAFETQGYHILEADSGEKCLRVCHQCSPSLILLDALMPMMDGFDCCYRLRQQLEDRCPPIFMITQLTDAGSITRALSVGVTDYITKPIHWPLLRQRVRQALNLRQSVTSLKPVQA